MGPADRGRTAGDTARLGIALVVMMVAASCAAEAPGVPSAHISDSAGVRLVSYDLTNVELPRFRLLGEPDVTIGERDGAPEHALSAVADLTVAEGAMIVVADAQSRELRLFDSAGAYVRTLGGPGEGPGEFSSAPIVAGVAADTLFAFDRRNARVTALTLAGDLVRTLTVADAGIGRASSLRRLRDGAYLAVASWTRPDEAVELHDPRLDLDSIVVLRLDGGGVLSDTLRVLPDRTRVRAVRAAPGGALGVIQAPTPYSPEAVVATNGAWTVLGRSDAFVLRLLGEERGQETLLRVAGVDHPATAEDIQSRQRGRLREEWGDREVPPDVLRLELDYLPDRLPAFGTVLIGDGGEVWVALPAYDLSNGLDWLVFTRAGELLGSVHSPPDFRVLHVTEAFVLGYALDELDVPQVRRYPLLPATGQTR